MATYRPRNTKHGTVYDIQVKRQRLVEYNCASTEYCSFGRRPKRSIKFLDDKQAKLFYGIVMNCEDIRIRTAFNIFIFTGLRRGEADTLNGLFGKKDGN